MIYENDYVTDIPKTALVKMRMEMRAAAADLKVAFKKLDGLFLEDCVCNDNAEAIDSLERSIESAKEALSKAVKDAEAALKPLEAR